MKITDKKPSPQSEHKPPGPVPDRVKIDSGSWENAVKTALHKKRPEGGWPTDKPPQKSSK